MSTDWWSTGQRWLEQQASKEAESQKRAWVEDGRSAKTFRYNPPGWHRDAVEALGRNDEETFKAIKLGQLGTRGLPPLRAPKRHHATEESPARLEREINVILASPASFSYEEAMAALEEKHVGVPRGGSLRSGHAPVVPKMMPSVLQMLKTYRARVRFEDQLKRASQHRKPDRPRWTAFIQDAFGYDSVGEGATKEAAARAAVAELPPNIRRHFEG